MVSDLLSFALLSVFSVLLLSEIIPPLLSLMRSLSVMCVFQPVLLFILGVSSVLPLSIFESCVLSAMLSSVSPPATV